MFVQNFVDFTGKNIVSAHNGHVFFAIHDKKVAVVILIGDIPGIEPALTQCARCLFRLVPVAEHNLRSAHHKFARGVGGQGLSAGFKVYDTSFCSGDGDADGTGLLAAVQRIGDDYGRCFGKAETFGNFRFVMFWNRRMLLIGKGDAPEMHIWIQVRS